MDKQLIDSYRKKILNNKIDTKREMYNKLILEMKKFNIIIIGLRQLGKTVLAEQLVQQYLSLQKEVAEAKDIFNFSIPKEEQFLYLNLKSFTNVTKESVQNEINGRNYKIVLIDEIQMIDDWSNLAQVLSDLNPNTRFIITGSNASALGDETAFQRFKAFNLSPLSFAEFKQIWKNDDFDTYLKYGSYPKIEKYDNPLLQYKEIIFDLIIDKVVSDDNEGMSVSKFRNFSKSIINYIGNEINQKQLSMEADLTRPTTKEYLKVMKNSMLIKMISKYKDKQKKPKQKVYFADKSMLPNFAGEMNNNLWGALIENVVFCKLSDEYNTRFGQDDIQYYRNQKQEEIDFIVPYSKILVEVKYAKELDLEALSTNLNKRLSAELSDYKKIVVTKEQKGECNGWEFIPLLEFIGE